MFDTIAPEGNRCGAGHWTPREQMAAAAPGPSFAMSEDVPAVLTQNGPGLPFCTARELAASAPDQVEWIAKPWVARGAIVELDGKLKSSGKTTLLTYVVREILDGGIFLGEPTMRTAVVYLTEQSRSTFKEALRRAGLLERDDLHILCWPEVRGQTWESLVAAAVALAARVEAGVLIVDTLGQWAGTTGDGENNAGEALRAMAPLQVAAAAGLGVVIARHERKSGGEVGDSARGSSQYSGSVDTIVSIRRPQGDAEAGANVRVLQSLSRFDEVPETLVVELTATGYQPLGTVLAYASDQAEQRLLEVLPPWQDKAQTADQLADAAKTTRSLTGKLLAEMAAAGKVCRFGKGKKGDPFRYWQESEAGQEMASSTTKSVVVDGSILGDAGRTNGAAAAVHSSTIPVVVDESGDSSAEDLSESSDSERNIHSSTTPSLYMDERIPRQYPCPGCDQFIGIDEACPRCDAVGEVK